MDADEAAREPAEARRALVAVLDDWDVKDSDFVVDRIIESVTGNPSFIAAFDLDRDVVLEALGGELVFEEELDGSEARPLAGRVWEFPVGDTDG